MTNPRTADASAIATYDVVPYVRRSFVEPHPDRLAVAATLFGLEPRPPEHCRVLEVGCATGATIVPLAYYLPDSEFVGVDVSGRQVAEGRAFIARLGLTNVHLHALDIRDVPSDWGPFDYIICHGVFSWVPRDVQDHILDVCARHLAPHGVAFVSYHTLPGGQHEATLRELSILRFGGVADFHERIRLARAFWERIPGDLARLRSPEKDGFGAFAQRLGEHPDGYLFHEFLEGNNERFYFHKFVDRAAGHGLQFLAETPVSKMARFVLPEDATDPPGADGSLGDDEVVAEQYLDLLLQRRFRHTLLCPSGVRVRRQVTPGRLTSLYVAAPVKPIPAAPGTASLTFEAWKGERLTVSFALAQAALEILGSRWPEAIAVEQLLGLAARTVDAEPGHYSALIRGTADRLLSLLLEGVTKGAVDARTYAPRVTLNLPDRPRLHDLARAEAELEICPSTPFRELFLLAPLNRAILLALDGRTERAQVLERLCGEANQGGLGEKYRVLAGTNPDWLREHLTQELDRTLQLAARNGLFAP